jgi:anti-sigma factor RsiW
VIAPFRRPCEAHRTALIDFADGRRAGARSAAALRHLDRCRDCEAQVTEFALAIAALRQLRLDIESAEPAADGWVRLKARIQARGIDPWRWRLTLGGLATSSMLVLVLIAPGSIGRPSIAEIAPAAPGPQTRAAARVEARYIATTRAGAHETAAEDVSSDGSLPIYFPDQPRPGRKEVAAASSPGRPPTPI